MNVVVIGAGGGIGSALVESLAKSEKVDQIHACSRAGKKTVYANVRSWSMQTTNEQSVQQVFGEISKTGVLDLVIVATGILHDGNGLQPEKSLQQLSAENLWRLFTVNCIGPALVAKHAIPCLNRDARAVFSVLSARVGSISDNRLGGWYSYRMSKAALNMFVRTTSIEVARTLPGAAVIGLHPGTVETSLSQPFKRNVPPSKLFQPKFAAGKLLDVIAGVSPADSGKVYAWDGSEILP